MKCKCNGKLEHLLVTAPKQIKGESAVGYTDFFACRCGEIYEQLTKESWKGGNVRLTSTEPKPYKAHTAEELKNYFPEIDHFVPEEVDKLYAVSASTKQWSQQ